MKRLSYTWSDVFRLLLSNEYQEYLHKQEYHDLYKRHSSELFKKVLLGQRHYL
jgi:hypothetical protein